MSHRAGAQPKSNGVSSCRTGSSKEYMFANRPVIVTDAIRRVASAVALDPGFLQIGHSADMKFVIEEDLKRKAG